MKVDQYGQMIYDKDEVFDILMHDVNPSKPDFKPGPFIIEDGTIDISTTNEAAGYEALLLQLDDPNLTVKEFDELNQAKWNMPQSYKDLDIAAHILSLCSTQAELQRCGEELLLFQDHNLFDLLRYVKYLVDTMELNNVVWGVGRGSSVSSYVLFKLRVHRIDSMFYDLDIAEFLRD